MSEEDKQKNDESGNGGSKYTEEEINELIDKLAQAEQDKTNTVEELKSLRSQKQAAEEELEKIKGEQDPQPREEDPEKVVKRVLSEREEEQAKQERERAIEEFKREHNEFAPDTDTTGLAFSKFENELNKFNLSGLKTKEEFKQRLQEAYDFMNRKKSKESDAPQYYSGTPAAGGSDPKEDDSAVISDAESKLMKELGWERERFLKMKEKRPQYIASLLQYRK